MVARRGRPPEVLAPPSMSPPPPPRPVTPERGPDHGHKELESEAANPDVTGSTSVNRGYGSTFKEHSHKCQSFSAFWQVWERSQCLSESEDSEKAVDVLPEFMAFRCFVHKDYCQSMREHFASIKFFPIGCSRGGNCQSFLVSSGPSVKKVLNSARRMTGVKPRVRSPLTREVLQGGREVIWRHRSGGPVAWVELALTYFLRVGCRKFSQTTTATFTETFD